eukprot:TRINITY_DN69388_c0_g1_i1.p1 TRINITY_DN69388_c0_g1~~TRINITY_DN69388_c0_g1_i1.p1  ORF type:complete len:285 (+),score=45.47 TRINITY_DN69388_c0_g1_i1:75-929(+)
MDDITKSFFATEVQGENAECFDCGRKDPQWASLSNGIYICIECSGRHRAIGCHLSFVRCLWMDKWKPEQLAMMRVGGNARLAKFLDDHGPSGWRQQPIATKYDSAACGRYRVALKECANALLSSQPQAGTSVSPSTASAKPTSGGTATIPIGATTAIHSIAATCHPAAPVSNHIGDAAKLAKPSTPCAATKGNGRVSVSSQAQSIWDAMHEFEVTTDSSATSAPSSTPVTPSPISQTQTGPTSKQLVASPLATPASRQSCAAQAEQPRVQAAAAVDIWGDDLWE